MPATRPLREGAFAGRFHRDGARSMITLIFASLLLVLAALAAMLKLRPKR